MLICHEFFYDCKIQFCIPGIAVVIGIGVEVAGIGVVVVGIGVEDVGSPKRNDLKLNTFASLSKLNDDYILTLFDKL